MEQDKLNEINKIIKDHKKSDECEHNWDYEIQITTHIYLEYLSFCKDNFLSSHTIAKLNDIEKMIKLLKRNNKRDKPRSLYDLLG